MKLEVLERQSDIQVDVSLSSFDPTEVFSHLPEYFFLSLVSHSKTAYTFYIPLSRINDHLPFGVKPLTWIWNSFIDAFYLTISDSAY